ncbi:MAG: YciI family protein [Candidatus Sulfotelmatobacter sp.]
MTLYWKNGKVATTDGPYAETKEQLGGIQILEARDLNHQSCRSAYLTATGL